MVVIHRCHSNRKNPHASIVLTSVRSDRRRLWLGSNCGPEKDFATLMLGISPCHFPEMRSIGKESLQAEKAAEIWLRFFHVIVRLATDEPKTLVFKPIF